MPISLKASTSALPPAPTQKRTSLKKGTLLNWVGLGLNFSVAFVVTPIIIRKLGASGFGMWALIQSFSGYYGLVNLGLASALQRFISRDLANDDTGSLQQTVGTAMAFFCGTGALILVAAATLAGPASRFFDIGIAETPIFAATLLFCALSVVADFFGALMGTLFTARERFDVASTLNISRQMIQSAGILFVLFHQPSVNRIAFVVCVVSLVSLVASWVIARQLYPAIRFSWQGGRYARLKELLHYGTSTVLLTISNVIRLRLGNIVIAKTVGLSAVGTFSVASNLVVNMNSIMASSLNVLNPRFTRLHTQDNRKELQQLYRSALFVSSVLASGMGLMMLVLGERFILLWVGQDFLPAAPILHVLTVAYVIAHAQAPAWNVMFALAKHHYMARVAIAEAIVIVVLGLYLSHTHGALGFAWATAISMIATKLFLQPSYAAKLADLTLLDYVRPMVIPFLVGMLLWSGTHVAGLGAALKANGILFFIGTAAGLGISFLMLVGLLARNKDYVPTFLAKYLRLPVKKAGLSTRTSVPIADNSQ